jgi:hypothetical protein
MIAPHKSNRVKRKTQDGRRLRRSIGEGSAFHETFGYYATGAGEETAILPEDWRSRLVPILNANTSGTNHGTLPGDS